MLASATLAENQRENGDFWAGFLVLRGLGWYFNAQTREFYGHTIGFRAADAGHC
jgi:hypothetical protein